MTQNKYIKKASFACGCFWSKEYHFSQLEGVVDTSVGFMGGHSTNPTYKEVCHKQTGHAETVTLRFDSRIISYQDLLVAFFNMHNATIDRRGKGGQYRSAIFFHDGSQKEIASQAIAMLREAGYDIKTELLTATRFYPAGERHQGYCSVRGMEPKANHGLPKERLREILAQKKIAPT